MAKKQFGISIIAAAIALTLFPALGGNLVFADGSSSSPLSTQSSSATAAQIQQIRQQIANLTQQIATQQTGRVLTSAELAAIEAQINAIRIKKEIIALQVVQIANERAAQEQARQINYQRISQALDIISKAVLVISQEMRTSGFVPAVIAPAVPSDNAAIEAQILAIQQKIVKLTGEMQALKASGAAQNESWQSEVETSAPSAASVQCDATTGICEVISNKPSPSQPTHIVVQEQPKKGFWQSVWDFIKNLFTF